MPVARNVYRRGAVYWWRRVCSCDAADVRPTIALSLGTKDAGEARVRAAAMTVRTMAMQETLLDRWKRDGLPTAQRNALLRREAAAYRDRLLTDPLEAIRFGEGASSEATLELCERGWATLIKCSLGCPPTPARLSHAACTAKNAEAVSERVRVHALDMSFREKLTEDAEAILDAEGIYATDLAKTIATGILVAARATAVRDHRLGTSPPSMAVTTSAPRMALMEMTSALAGGMSPVQLSVSYSLSSKACSLASATSVSSTASPVSPAAVNTSMGELDWSSMTPTQVAEKFIRSRYQDDELEHRYGGKRAIRKVDEHTLRQVRWAARLLEKSMRDSQGAPRAISTLRKEDLIDLDKPFEDLPRSTGKSEWDRRPSTTLSMIISRVTEQIAKGKKSNDNVGLDSATTNKHFGKLSNILYFLKTKIAELPAIDFGLFLTSDGDDVRNDQVAYTTHQIEELFNLPPWTGCLDEFNRSPAGKQRFSDTLVWVLLLAWYTGARREEICKLLVSEVWRDCGIWYLVNENNGAGRVKNDRSVRYISICDELLRLGFVEFAKAIKDASHAALFPDLLTMSGKGKKGDVFYDLFWVKLAKLLPWLEPGQAIRSNRHSVSTEWKLQEVPSELRKDALGQGGENDEQDRYAKAIALPKSKELNDKIPVVTTHLAPFLPVVLVPSDIRKPRPQRTRRPKEAY